MRQVTANSGGTNWRLDVFEIAKSGAVEVVDQRGMHLGTVTIRGAGKRAKYLLNGVPSNFSAVWRQMDMWSGDTAQASK